jgi:hypothetical protein
MMGTANSDLNPNSADVACHAPAVGLLWLIKVNLSLPHESMPHGRCCCCCCLRRKDLKNPRKKHRVKFAQAVVRRKGQVQGMQSAPGNARGYGGEATGIKSRVAKSTRLG